MRVLVPLALTAVVVVAYDSKHGSPVMRAHGNKWGQSTDRLLQGKAPDRWEKKGEKISRNTAMIAAGGALGGLGTIGCNGSVVDQAPTWHERLTRVSQTHATRCISTCFGVGGAIAAGAAGVVAVPAAGKVGGKLGAKCGRALGCKYDSSQAQVFSIENSECHKDRHTLFFNENLQETQEDAQRSHAILSTM
ncbi:hypothetical protein AC1031_018994 [Aphanomyces cochlioides]|nr:hypothetical protein AC1031_018994 [Aphanomyces cochlioides]